MIESDLLEDQQSKIAFFKKHVIEQDTEIYKLFKRIDGLVKAKAFLEDWTLESEV